MRPKKPKPLEKVTKEYIDNCLAYAEARRAGNYVAGNPYARKLGKAAALLRHDYGEEGWKILYEFMEHENTTVQSVTAALCLDMYPEKAVSILDRISNLDGLDAFSSKYALINWRLGITQFPGGSITNSNVLV